MQQILNVEERIGVQINNAGFGLYEAIEAVPIQKGPFVGNQVIVQTQNETAQRMFMR